MSLGVLVIEASSRSGALITARLCAEDHNREVLAVPERVDSRASDGCHRIIREGWATLVTNVADVLDALGDTGQLLKAEMEQAENGHGVGVGARKKQLSNNGTSRVTSKENKASANDSLLVASLTESQQKIAKVLEGGDTLALDQIAAQSGLPVHVIEADMTMLQIRGLVARQAGRFVRVK
jgi:DNA processing protein